MRNLQFQRLTATRRCFPGFLFFLNVNQTLASVLCQMRDVTRPTFGNRRQRRVPCVWEAGSGITIRIPKSGHFKSARNLSKSPKSC